MSWLGNWKYRRQITIDHNDVGATLTQFPVLIYLSSISGIGGDDVTSIFDELGANSKKIAVTKDDGTTQLYVEIEKWDSGNEKAWLWVSLSGWNISKLVDTIIYIYYDSSQDDNTTYVGDIEARPEVWDDNFKLVWHMRDKTTSSVADSTSNNNDGTKGAANGPAVTTSGKIDDAQNFDGNNDIISLTDASLDSLDKITIECWINPYTWGAVLHRTVYRKVGKWNLVYDKDVSKMYLYATWTGSTASWRWEETPIQSWTHLVVSYDGTSTANDPTIYYNNVVQTESEITAPSGDIHAEGLSTNYIGAKQPGVFEDPIEGTIDEFRISDINRPVSWVKATYETGRDHFVTYGSEETLPDPPTNCDATDGTYGDKVVVTWTKSIGASHYRVWTGSSWTADLGDVDTYDHTTGPAPTITPGDADASDGAHVDYVTLSVSGEGGNNGSSVSYKVQASADGIDWSGDSNTDTGYRGTSALGYQWYRSAGDSDDDYSSIDGGTTDPYNDTGAPANGDGRYYKCLVSMTGASSQYTTVDRGYRKTIPGAVIRLGNSIVLPSVGAIVPTSAGAEQKQMEGTNHSYYVLAFDKTTVEKADWQFLMPSSYGGGNVKVQIYWVATPITGGVVFDVNFGNAGDSDSCDPVLDTQACAAVTVDGVSRDINISSCTLTTPFDAGEYGIIRIHRETGDGGDTMAGDAEIIGVILQWV